MYKTKVMKGSRYQRGDYLHSFVEEGELNIDKVHPVHGGRWMHIDPDLFED